MRPVAEAIGIWEGNASPGTQLAQWVDDGGSDKLWNLVPTTDGYYRIQSAKNTSLYMTGTAYNPLRLGTAIDTSSDPTADYSQQWELVPSYSVSVVSDLTKPVKAGATLPIKIQATDAFGDNVSASSITVHATGLDGSATVPAPGNSQAGQNFSFDPTTGQYQYDVNTTGLSSGQHTPTYTIGSDPTVRSLTFRSVRRFLAKARSGVAHHAVGDPGSCILGPRRTADPEPPPFSAAPGAGVASCGCA